MGGWPGCSMALMLPRSVFFHIPKTGGIWVRQAIRNAGIPVTEAGETHSPYRRVDRKGKFTFTFVRHPETWYPSFWSYRMAKGWKSEDRMDPFMSLSFEGFVRSVVRRSPGSLSLRYEAYVGPEPGVLDFVGKMENLASDLVKALRLAGEEFDEEKLRRTPPENVSLLRPVYTKRLREAVLKSERKALERFAYL